MTDSANTKHIGDLIVTKGNAANVAHITEVTGNLHILTEGVALPVLTSVGGALYILAEGVALPVLTSVGGHLYITIGIHFDHSHIAFGAGQVLAVWKYALHVKDGQYRAGCRGPWSAEEALAHWHAGHPEPSRAEEFREAIAAQEAAKEPA